MSYLLAGNRIYSVLIDLQHKCSRRYRYRREVEFDCPRRVPRLAILRLQR